MERSHKPINDINKWDARQVTIVVATIQLWQEIFLLFPGFEFTHCGGSPNPSNTTPGPILSGKWNPCKMRKIWLKIKRKKITTLVRFDFQIEDHSNFLSRLLFVRVQRYYCIKDLNHSHSFGRTKQKFQASPSIFRYLQNIRPPATSLTHSPQSVFHSEGSTRYRRHYHDSCQNESLARPPPSSCIHSCIP